MMNVEFATRDVRTLPLLDRKMMIKNLSVLRHEWEKAADNDSLLNISTPVGLLLFDISIKLGLTPDEQADFLGRKLDGEVATISSGESAL